MTRRAIAALVVAATLLASCSGGSEGPTQVGLPYSDYAHEDEPFAEELFAEQARIPRVADPELIWVADDYDATYTHVRDLVRASHRGSGEGPTVWFFGGSSLFGVGQRDEHTVPSELVRIAEAAGTPIQAENFGFSGYFAWQEVALMRRMLAQRPTPELIVFFHGINDLAMICRQLALGMEPDGLGEDLTDAPPQDPVVDCFEDPEATGELVAASTDRAMDDAAAIAGPIPLVEFWQPFAATRAAQPSDEGLLERLTIDREGFVAQGAPYLVALEKREVPPVDLTDALDDHPGPIFFDWAHTNELGARLAAEAMWERSLAAEVAALGES